MAPSSFITNAAYFQAADELRRIQWTAYRAKSLALDHDAALASSAHTRHRWEEDAAWQRIREAVEKMLIAYDWGEAFVALHLTVKPVLDAVFNVQLAELARAHEDTLLALMLDEFALDNAIPGKELKSIKPKGYESRARTTHALEGPMLMQEKISGPETLLKLYVAIDEDLKALQPQFQARQLPRDPRGGTPTLSAAEVLTILVWGAWRGLTDKAKVYFHVQTCHRQEFPTLGAYSKFVEAPNRYSVELRALLALMLHRNRQAQGVYPIVLQDSTALAVCHVARARQHRTFREWARKSKNGMGWWYGFKLHVQCDEAGRLCGFDLTTATVDDRKLLDPLTRWMTDGIVVGDGGYLSQAKARALAQRGVYLLTPTRKNMRHLASQFQLACLQLRHRVEEVFAFLKQAFGAVRTTHRAAHALPIHLLCCLLAYSLYKALIA